MIIGRNPLEKATTEFGPEFATAKQVGFIGLILRKREGAVSCTFDGSNTAQESEPLDISNLPHLFQHVNWKTFKNLVPILLFGFRY